MVQLTFAELSFNPCSLRRDVILSSLNTVEEPDVNLMG